MPDPQMTIFEQGLPTQEGIVARIEGEGWLWEVGKHEDGYHATVWIYEGRERRGAYSRDGADSPLEALQDAYASASQSIQANSYARD